MEPRRFYLSRHERRRKLESLWGLIQPCRLCPHNCGARRLDGEVGLCGVGRGAPVGYYGPHLGEEPPIVGKAGAGNIFFAGCNLQCVFCQNHQISHVSRSTRKERDFRADSKIILESALSGEKLARAHLELQGKGCMNIAWVTAAHVLPQAVDALFDADGLGLELPLVYNSGGYERVETLELLDGIVDVYVPDLKYGPDAKAGALCNARDYFGVATDGLREMVRQVGHLELDETGFAVRGVLVRHLVLPGDLADTRGVLSFLAEVFGSEIWISLMSQYNPPAHVMIDPRREQSQDDEGPIMQSEDNYSKGIANLPLDRLLKFEEYDQAVSEMERLGLCLGWVQSHQSSSLLNPDFTKEAPFDGGVDAAESAPESRNF